MVRAIVAIDDKRGMATDEGIPWKLPSDVKHYLKTIAHSEILMGYGTYNAVTRPQTDRMNFVATSLSGPLRPGFQPVRNARTFLSNLKGNIWHIGGAGLLETTFDMVDELYITQLKGDYSCTKFMPEYEHEFELSKATDFMEDNGITFRYEIWKRKQ